MVIIRHVASISEILPLLWRIITFENKLTISVRGGPCVLAPDFAQPKPTFDFSAPFSVAKQVWLTRGKAVIVAELSPSCL